MIGLQQRQQHAHMIPRVSNMHSNERAINRDIHSIQMESNVPLMRNYTSKGTRQAPRINLNIVDETNTELLHNTSSTALRKDQNSQRLLNKPVDQDITG